MDVRQRSTSVAGPAGAGGEPVRIVTYRDELAPAFESLNREWLEAHDLLEPLDLEYLTRPRQRIIEAGGQIYFAVAGGGSDPAAWAVLGTCAAIPHGLDALELAKLAVAPAARGRGIGTRLVRAVLEHARRAGAAKVVLVSSTKLGDALRLYEALGFEHRPLPADPGYATADVYMELELYTPVACGLYDRLQAVSTLRKPAELTFRDAAGAEATVTGLVTDVYTRGAAEYVKLDDRLEIRLDRLLRLDGRPCGADAGPGGV
jgi:ribosomal protein S18 acetylase RimI-like enzyme